MDPEAALKELRELTAKLVECDLDCGSCGVSLATLVDASRLAELFDGLDDWIKSGGFLPEDWRRA